MEAKNKEAKKQVFVALSEKGGVGKSTFIQMLTDFMRRGPLFNADLTPMLGEDGEQKRAAHNVLVVDCNPKVGQLAASYGLKDASGEYDAKANLKKPFEGVLTVDIRDKTEALKLLDFLDLEPEKIILDMPGGGVNDVKAILGDVDKFIKEYQKEVYEVIVFNVIDHLVASARNVGPIFDAWSAANRFVVVKNLGKAEAHKFIFFDGEYSEEAGNPMERVKTAKGVVIGMPKIEEDTFALFDAKRITFSMAADNKTSPLTRAHRSRLREFMNDCDAEIAKLKLV